MTYYSSGRVSVVDNDSDFAKYRVTNTNRVFDNLDTAILYAIGASKENCSDSELATYVDIFITMINKKA